jgi:hypothetical protein
MDKVSRTIKEMLKDLVERPKVAITKRTWLIKRKGVTFTITVERGDKLND